MKTKVSLSILVCALILASASFAKAASDVNEMTSGLSVQLNLGSDHQGNWFKQTIAINFSKNISIQDLRANLTEGEWMRQTCDNVKNACYVHENQLSKDPKAKLKPRDRSTPIAKLDLAIGKAWVSLQHSFRCEEQIEATTWSLICYQIPLGKGADVLVDSTRSTICSAPAGGLPSCEFTFHGYIKDYGDYAGPKISYGFMVEEAKFISRVSFILNGVVNDFSKTRKPFEASAYAAMLKKIEDGVPEFVVGQSLGRETAVREVCYANSQGLSGDE